MPENSVSVSDILRASVCPMQLYLAKSSPANFTEPLRYSVAKQLSYHLGEEFNREENREKIREELLEHGVFHVTIETEKSLENCKSRECEVSSHTHSLHAHHHHHH